MAIKVSGTEVISDSRGLNNIASVDATTVASLSAAGVGGGGTADFVASGAISSGEVVSLNPDGTVSVSVSTGGGTPTAAGSLDAGSLVSTYDSNSNKVIVAYQEGNDADYVHAVVGTVSGTSISFGTGTRVLAQRPISMGITFDSNSNKVVIAVQSYSDGTGRAVVGTVSGTSISFGSPVNFVFNPGYVSATFDSTNNKVVIGFNENNYLKAVVGTVSGTSISFGSLSASSVTHVEDMKMVFDSNAGKVVFDFKRGNAGNAGAGVVGTVSGTSISFGSLVEYEGGSTNKRSVAFDSSSNKVITAFQDNGTSSLAAVVGTVSGTSISYGVKTTFAPSNNTQQFGISYDPIANKTVFVYQHLTEAPRARITLGTVSGTAISFSSEYEFAATAGTVLQDFAPVYDSDQEKTVIFDVPNSTRDLEATVFNIGNGGNFIGVASEDISDTSTGTVTILGGINESLSNLSISSQYYLNSAYASAGDLITSSASGVKVGRALSATQLLITEGNTQ